MAKEPNLNPFRNNDVENNRKATQDDANRSDVFPREPRVRPQRNGTADGAHADTEAVSDARPGADKQR